MNEYDHVQTVRCPVCKMTDLVDAWKPEDVQSACRTWVCRQCKNVCVKEIFTRVEYPPFRGYNVGNIG